MIDPVQIDLAVQKIDESLESLKSLKSLLSSTPDEPSPDNLGDFSVNVSIEKGSSPLPVRFEANLTGFDGNRLADVKYEFEFGDDDTKTWDTTGNHKNSTSGGPLAFHLYNNPGLVRAKITAKKISDDSFIASVYKSIVVDNPNEVYAGNNTVVISMASPSTVPSEYQLIVNPARWPEFQSDTRYLLIAGQDYSSLGAISIRRKENVRFGILGNVGYAVVSDITPDNGKPSSLPSNYCKNVVFSDIDCQKITIDTSADNIGFARMKFRSFNVGNTVNYYLADGTLDQISNLRWPTNISLCDSYCDDPIKNYILGEGISIAGNVIDNADKDDIFQHCLRFPYTKNCVIEENRLANAGSTQHEIKFHSKGVEEGTGEPFAFGNDKNYSRNGVIRNNICGDGSEQHNPWPIQVSPQNTIKTEGIMDVVIENNQFINFVNPSFVACSMGGQNIVFRGHGPIRSATNQNMRQMPAPWIDAEYHITE